VRSASKRDDSSVKTTIGQRFARRVLGGRATSPIVVVLPVKEGSSPQIRELLASGPPFDPTSSGLDQHHVFLTDQEVVFLFEAADASALERLIADTGVWDAAIAWREHMAGPPRVAKEAYSWTRTQTPEGISFASTPGPGDSEGGDVYPP
jgi:hypothetical protein